MNIKTIFFENFVNFVDTTKKQNAYFEVIIVLFVIITSLFFLLLLFKYLNEKPFFARTNIQNSKI